MLPEPYYQSDRITLYNGDSRILLAEFEDRSVDCVITDPPYTERTHANTRKNSSSGVVHGVSEFAAISEEELRTSLYLMGTATRGWLIATLDYKHAVELESGLIQGLKTQRIGVWVKTNPTPQITGDRPAQGWEAISYMHRDDCRSVWYGGGDHGNFISPIPDANGHPTAKPLELYIQFLTYFTKEDDVILDPFAGSGTLGVACLRTNRKCILIEQNRQYCDLAVTRFNRTSGYEFAEDRFAKRLNSKLKSKLSKKSSPLKRKR